MLPLDGIVKPFILAAVSPNLTGLVFSAGAAVATFLGGLLVTAAGERYKNSVKYFMAAGAGFLLSVVFFEAVPRTVAELGESFALWFLAGYLLVHLVEHTWVAHFHFGEEIHPEELSATRSGVAASIGLLVHAFFDGFAITAAAQFSLVVGTLMFVAVGLHKLPEGFTVASLNLAAGRSQKTALGWAGLLGAATLLGAFVSGFLNAYPAEMFAFSGGVALYVAASDLVPEVNRFSGIKTPASVFLGVLFFYLTEQLLHAIAGR